MKKESVPWNENEEIGRGIAINTLVAPNGKKEDMALI